MRIILQEQRINHENPMLDQLRIACKPALKGVMSIFCLGHEVAESEGTA